MKCSGSHVSKAAMIAERLKRNVRGLLKILICMWGSANCANWIDGLNQLNMKYSNTVQSAIKFERMESSLKKNKIYVYDNVINKGKKTEGLNRVI